MKIEDITALILCGGLGMRIAPFLPPNTPKCMADINGRPFIDILLGFLRGQRLNQFILLTGHHAQNIKTITPVKTNYSLEQLGTGGHIVKALRDEDISDPFVVINGDTYCPINYESLLKHHLRPGNPDVTILENREHRNTGVFVFSKSFFNKAGPMPTGFELEGDLLNHHRGFSFIMNKITLHTSPAYCDIGTLHGLVNMGKQLTFWQTRLISIHPPQTKKPTCRSAH